MKLYRYSIPFKLFALFLPMVSLPIIIVGYWAYHTSVDSVTKLSKDHQLIQAREAAQNLDNVFRAGIDLLEVLSQLAVDIPTLSNDEDVAVSEEFTFGKMKPLMHHMLLTSSDYFQIRVVDQDGKILIDVNKEPETSLSVDNEIENFSKIREFINGESVDTIYISAVLNRIGSPEYYIQLGKPIFGLNNRVKGAVILYLNFSRMIQYVQTIRLGHQGHGILVDGVGSTIAHPQYKPYDYDLTRYSDPDLREFVVHMLSGETGWMTFKEQGEQAAAFAPVSIPGWSLAVSIPIDEFKYDARLLKKNVMQVVLVMILLSALLVIYISFRILRPIRKLVLATEQVAEGDLTKEIKVQSNDELGMLTECFNKMVRSLRDVQRELVASEKLISLGRLSAGVAHEIRNPLNAMKGAITYLQRKKSADETVIEFTDIILEEVDRLDEFVTDFLVYAKQSEPKKSPSDIHDLLHSALTLFQSEFESKNILVVTKFDEPIPTIGVDPQQFQQVFLNAFVNSLDAMEIGGKLQLKVSHLFDENGSHVTIEIEDDGVGISKEDIKYIFDPFFSAKDNGTGLGLPISRSIIENHGGRIVINSTKGKGTQITIYLPVSNEQETTSTSEAR